MFTGKPRILLIEDEVELCQAMMFKLGRLGTLGNASSVQESIRLLEQYQWNLIVMDYGLIDGTSAAVLPTLWRTQIQPAVIAISASPHSEALFFCTTNSVVFLPKPFSLVELYAHAVESLKQCRRAG